MSETLAHRNGSRPAVPRRLSVVAAIRRRPLLAFGTPVLVIGLTVLFVLWVPPLFQSSTLIRIDEDDGALSMLPAALQSLTLGGGGSELQTEIAVLQSRSLAERVVRETALQLALVEPARTRRSEILSAVQADTAALETTYTLERAAPGRFRVSALVELPAETLRPFTRPSRELRDVGEVEVGVPAELDGVRLTLRPGAADHDVIVLHLATFADAVDDFAAALVVGRPDREANVVQLVYQNGDPELAQRVLDAHAATFIERRQGSRSSEARTTVGYLAEQLDTMGIQLRSAQEALRDFSAANRIVAPEAEAEGRIGLLVDMQAQRDLADAERSALAELMAEIRAEVAAAPPASESPPGTASPYRRLFGFPPLLESAATGELLGQLSELENQLTEMLATLRPGDRDVTLLLERIAAVESQLQATGETYLTALDRQVGSYDATLAAFQGDLARIPDAQMNYFRLRHEAETLAELYTLLQTRLKEAELQAAVEDHTVQVVDPALYPREPIRPRPALSLFMAAMMGSLLGLGGAVAAEHRDRSVRDRRDVGRVTGAAVLGQIPELRRAPARTISRLPMPWFGNGHDARPQLVSVGAVGEPAVEAYRSLRTNLLFSRMDRPPHAVVFTSPMPGDGKSTTAVNLALVLAQQGQRILLVDADMRRGVLHEVLSAPRQPGLSEVLSRKVALADAVSSVEPAPGARLDFLPSGIWAANPAELVASSRTRELLESTRDTYDMVILDAPPLNVVTDAAVLGTHCDGVILVARAGITEESPLEYAVEQLARVRAPLLGTVLNGVDEAGQEIYGSRKRKAAAYLRGS